MELSENKLKAKDYLQEIRNAERRIVAKKSELAALRYKASGAGAIVYDKERVQTSPKNYMEMAIEDIVCIEEEIAKEEEQIEQKKGEAYAIVRRIEDPEQRAVIEWFYLNALNLSSAAAKLFMSERKAYYLRKEALESFGALMA